MTNVLLRKSFLVKLLAVVVTVALMLTVAPFADIANFALTANAEAPVFDETLGRIEESGSTLKAVAGNGAGFRGWYLKDGTEVSYSDTITIESGKTKDDYVPVFYNFNLNENASFENELTDNDKWYLYGQSQTLEASVKEEYAKTGTKAIRAKAPGYTTYHEFKNIVPNTQYTISFSYYIPPVSGSNYLEFVSVLGEDMTLTEKANSDGEYLTAKQFDKSTGVCASGVWNDVSITFCSAQNESVKLALRYISSNSAYIYIDDVSLVEDIVAEPGSYFNEDFTLSGKTWKAVKTEETTLSVSDGALQVTVNDYSAPIVYSAPFMVKEGASYTLSFNLDLSSLSTTDHMQIFLSTTPGSTAGRYSYDKSLYTWTVKKKKYSWSSTYTDEVISNVGSFITIKSNAYNSSSYNNGKTTMSVTFTAHETSVLYLHTNLQNVAGTYLIDNLTIAETVDIMQYVKDQALAHVGSAIRTEGVQGLRYKTGIDKKFLTSDMPYGIRLTEYGTLAIKTEYLGGGELTLNGEYTYNGQTKTPGLGVAYSFNEKFDKVFSEDANKIYFTGVLTGIGTKNYNTYYTARAYFKYVDEDGKEGIIYSAQNDVAVYPVAKAAYSKRNYKNEYVESESVRDYLLKNIINRYADKVVNVKNNSTPIYNNFQGISSTVYHGTVFFEDSHGRTYNDSQAQTEIERLVDSGITNVRTRFASQWMEAANNAGWNWETDKMQKFYKWAKMIQDNGISITLNIGWHLVDFTEFYDYHFNGDSAPASSGSNGHSSIKEVNYLHGYLDNGTTVVPNMYGEDAKASDLTNKGKALGLNLTDSEYSYFSVAAARYAEWGKQALLQLKAHGINNVEYIMPFTETGYYTKEGTSELDPTYCYDEWIFMTMALQDALVEEGIRSNYKLIGPSQALNNNSMEREVQFVEYIYEKIGTSEDYANMIDINAMHTYPKPNTNKYLNADIYTPDAVYDTANTTFAKYDEILKNANQRDKEFWCDEYFVKSDDVSLGDDNAMLLTQFAAGMVSGMNLGINRFVSWQMFDTLWDANAKHTTGEFVGGIHEVGTCPRLIGSTCNIADCGCKDYTLASSTPRKTYYGINLLGKYLNNKNASVLATEIVDEAVESDSGIFTSAIINDAGQTVILVVNTLDVVTTVDINLEKAEGAFFRYVYNSNDIVATPDATSIPSDKTIKIEDGVTSFVDAVPAQSFAIYVQSDVQYGDVDMDGGNLFD